jgi:hypothetical protein
MRVHMPRSSTCDPRGCDEVAPVPDSLDSSQVFCCLLDLGTFPSQYEDLHAGISFKVHVNG